MILASSKPKSDAKIVEPIDARVESKQGETTPEPVNTEHTEHAHSNPIISLSKEEPGK